MHLHPATIPLVALTLASCIQSEPLNSECDIEYATVEADNWQELFYSENDMAKEVPSADSTVVFYLLDGFADFDKLTSLQVYFDITEGATISPESGSAQDFSGDGVNYRVTSEDGSWWRDYTVKFTTMPSLITDLSFENYQFVDRYYEWYELSTHGDTIFQWASGNPGFAISRSSATTDEFPTLPYDDDCISGHAVKLETCDTGPFGAMVNMRLAAGNLFIGTFDVTYALLDAMAATNFGLPFNKKPISFEGYYKYQPGDDFQNRKGTILEDSIDAPDLYAILYKNTDDNGAAMTLKGDDVLTNDNIVAMARVTNPVYDFNTWTYYNIPFDYYSDVDDDLLKNYGYSLAVVFTSSIEGASFSGAIGSTLIVDEVKVNCQED